MTLQVENAILCSVENTDSEGILGQRMSHDMAFIRDRWGAIKDFAKQEMSACISEF